MTLLILGIVLWWAGHFFKRVLPDLRARLGNAGKGVSALIILAGVILMVIGYRRADFTDVYDPPSWGIHANNLLMLLAVILFGTGSSKSSLRGAMRHPMLTGMLFWAFAHLLVRGDIASVALFGSMAIWAVAEMVVINAREPDYTPWDGGSVAGTVRLLLISFVVYLVIAGVHWWIGYWPFAV